MSPPRSRYKASAPPDYSHRLHAGNVGDVWKHCILTEVLARVASGTRPVHYLETHAGEGLYPLASTGEWTEGIGRLWSSRDPVGEAVARYLDLTRRLAGGGDRPARYPGSPWLARAVLGDAARLTLWERDATAAARLAEAVPDVARTRLVADDGLRQLPAELATAERGGDAVVLLVDPPYGDKADWIRVPDAVIAATRATRHACLLLWYPVKSLTRPNAMAERLEAAGVSGALAELITTPLAHQRGRLNGSGMLLVRPPGEALPAIAAAAPVLGERCAVFPGRWSLRVRAFAPGGHVEGGRERGA